MAISRIELEQFYASSEVPLYNFAIRWVWNPSVAEDLVQEAFLLLWRRRDEIEIETLRGLAFKMVQNLALKEFRRNKLRATIPLLGWLLEKEGLDVEAEFVSREGLASVRKALDEISVELRETLLLCQFADLSYAQIGAILEIPEGTVASRKNRALKILRAKLEAYPEVNSNE